MASITRLLAGVLLVGVVACSHVDVASPNIRGIAYVNTNKATKAHPLYSQLQDLDAAIAAIDLSASVPMVPKSPAEMKAAIASIKAQLAQAETQSSQAIGALQSRLAKEERTEVAAALRSAGLNSAAQAYESAPLISSASQAQAIEKSAANDLQSYQKSVVAQGQATMGALEKRLHEQAQGRFETRAAQYAREESDLSLRLSQQDANQRLALQTKLNNLALDDAQRKALTSQLKAIDRNEKTQVGAMHARHRRDLQAYQNALQAGIMKQIRTHANALQAQTQTRLQARQKQVSQQLAALSGPRLPANLPTATKAQLQQIASNLQQRYQTDITKISDQFNQTRSDLEAQYEALNGVDVGAVGAAKQQRDQLAKERGDLYKKIEDQIAAAARRIAKRDGFSVVLLDPIAHPGGYDLTGDVISSLKSTGT
ncbi:MAG: hypothetical protein HKL92_02235 [Candidatus Eremiobacteraeota bacterium]|nr:hypothetical protein [Candidatus Eremiobacteraeota bacterium]NNM92141.1 hypothetical protein [Candidatus Eremiobacteraeota bacterium]